MPNPSLFRWILILSFLAMLNIGNTSAADTNLPSYYPSSFQHEGFLREISGDGTLMISGIQYNLSPNVLIHSLTTEHSSRFALNEGQEVGFTASRDTRVITELWILPKDSVKDA